MEDTQNTATGFHPIASFKRGVIAVVKFIAQIFTESDANGGKASYSRVAGLYIIFKIVALTEGATIAERANAVSPQLMWMFNVLVGYQILSKVLSSLSPAVLDLFRSILIKAGVTVQLPAVPEVAKA